MGIKKIGILTIAGFLAFSSVAQINNESESVRASDYSDEDKATDQVFIEKCAEYSEAIYSSKTLICFKGGINSVSGPKVVGAMENHPDATLVISSLGGDTSEAIKIGKAIASRDRRIIISGMCHSSCANYIAPAAHQIVVWENSVIMMHGSLPRSFGEFYRSFPGKSQSVDINDILNSEAFNRAVDIFPRHIATSVVDESVYFSELTPNEHYLHRYWEVERNIRLYAKPVCHPKNGFDLVVGPNYANEFSFRNIEYFWWPDKQRVLEATGFRKDDAVIVLDMDLMPSWVPGTGFVKQGECFKQFEE